MAHADSFQAVQTPPHAVTARHDADRMWLGFALILAVYLALGVWLIWRLPAFVGPVEGLHYEHVALLRRTGQPPDPATSTRPDERHQPPVYYTVAALLAFPFPNPPLDTEFEPNPHYLATHRGNLQPKTHVNAATAPVLYAGRVAALLFGAIGLFGLALAARQSLPADVTLLVVGLLAFNPTYLFLSAVMGNDLAATATGGLTLAYSAWLIVRTPRPAAFLGWGALFALAMLTKASAAFLVIALPLACLAQWQTKQAWKPAVDAFFIGVLGFLPFWGGWLLYNTWRAIDPLALSASLPLSRVLSLGPTDYWRIVPFLGLIWRSIWLDWSAGEVGFAPDWVYWVPGFFLLGSLAGWLRLRSPLRQPLLLILLYLFGALSLAALFLSVKTLMVKDAGYVVPEGRWMLPALPCFIWLVGVGWARWWPSLARPIATYSVLAVYAVGVVILAFLWLPILYPQAQQLSAKAELLPTAQRVDLHFGNALALDAVASEPFVIGQQSVVTLDWRALTDIQHDYTVSLQLLTPDDTGALTKLDWQNSYPGSGASPTRGWRTDDRIRDRMLLLPQGQFSGPTRAILGVWVLGDLKAEETLAAVHDGAEADPPVVQTVVVRPAQPLTIPHEIRLSEPVVYGDLIELQGVGLAQDESGLGVTLWWEALGEPPGDYTVFVQALDANGQLIAQDDSPPNAGRSPTSIWRAGDRVRDSHRLEGSLPPDATLLIGLYDPITMERLAATQGGVPLVDHAWPLPVPPTGVGG